MSSFYCSVCGRTCSDTARGYETGCEHNPVDMSALFWRLRTQGEAARDRNPRLTGVYVALVHWSQVGVTKGRDAVNWSAVDRVMRRLREPSLASVTDIPIRQGITPEEI